MSLDAKFTKFSKVLTSLSAFAILYRGFVQSMLKYAIHRQDLKRNEKHTSHAIKPQMSGMLDIRD